jgi:hypothetical protein
MDGSLRYAAVAPPPAAGDSSFFFWTLLPPELEDLGEEAFFSPPPEGLLTLLGLAAVPPDFSEAFPGLSGLRIARGPDEFVAALEDGRLTRLSCVSPPPRPSFRRRTRLPSSGWTEIFEPAGLRLRLWFVRLILFRLLRESPRRAFCAICGSLS